MICFVARAALVFMGGLQLALRVSRFFGFALDGASFVNDALLVCVDLVALS